MNDITTLLAKHRLLDGKDIPDSLVQLLTLGHKLGFDHIDVSFSGSGDSGDVDSTYFYLPDGTKLDKSVGTEVDDGSGWRKTEWSQNPKWTDEHDQLESLGSKVFYDCISDRLDWDWYNNDGGGGTATIHITTGKVECSGYYYETVAHDTDGCVFDLLGIEEEEE